MAKKTVQAGIASKNSVSAEDVAVMEKIRKIVQKGDNAEIKQGTDGKLKVYQVSKVTA